MTTCNRLRGMFLLLLFYYYYYFVCQLVNTGEPDIYRYRVRCKQGFLLCVYYNASVEFFIILAHLTPQTKEEENVDVSS